MSGKPPDICHVHDQCRMARRAFGSSLATKAKMRLCNPHRVAEKEVCVRGCCLATKWHMCGVSGTSATGVTAPGKVVEVEVVMEAPLEAGVAAGETGPGAHLLH